MDLFSLVCLFVLLLMSAYAHARIDAINHKLKQFLGQEWEDRDEIDQ